MKITPGSALNSALSGMQAGKDQVADAAHRVARSGSDGGESLTQAMVDLKLGENQVKANAAVFKSVSDLEDSVLSILA